MPPPRFKKLRQVILIINRVRKIKTKVRNSPGKNAKTGSPSNDNAPSQNQQYPPIIQWPYTPQLPAIEQSPLISKSSIPNVSPSPVVLSRWQQLPNQQPNPTNCQVQQGQPPLQLAQPAPPFWLPQRPGHHFVGVNTPATYHPFSPMGTTDASLQASAIAGGGTSSRHQPQVPNFCYHVGYPYPGFPGLWDPSSWWAQGQQSQPPCTYNIPGAYGYISPPTLPMPSHSATSGQSFPRGIIRPPEKLSQKHQKLWEAQSSENVQVWTIIGHLQSELVDYKNRITNLEAEVSSLKATVEEAATQGTGTSLHGQMPKRGRPKRPIASVGVLPSPDESHPRARGRKPAARKVQSETKALNFEKESLNKVEDKEKTCHPTTTFQQENDQKISNIFTNSSGNFEIHGSNSMIPAFHNQVHQEIPGVQASGVGLNSSPEMKTNDDKAEDSKTAFSILSQHVKGNKSKSSSATNIGGINNGGLGWPSNITSEDQRGNVLHIRSQGFYHNGSVVRQGGKFFSGWSFMNEEDASGELEDAMVGSAKDEDEEEMEDDVSSGAEEIAQSEDQNAYNMDAPGGTSPSGLPQLKSW
ncbi:hypothetical protein L1049_025204 [Liquidambar formosana]|uniref:Uncharacterized protein n=1 Tax=Liquidambar formosana TaxID=63359 RepID=A0AAP0X1S6_LIQFO